MTKLQDLEVPRTKRPPATLVAMNRLRPGASGLIRSLDLDGDADRGRMCVLGLCVGRRIRVVRTGDPQIVAVFSGRVGISAELARKVFVELSEPARPGSTR